MTNLRRLSDSCVLVTDDTSATLFDPGFHTFTSGAVDLESIGDVTRVMVTHEHGDHVSPDFLTWLIDRRSDLEVFSNDAVRDLLARHDIEARTDLPDGVSSEDVAHEVVPSGASPPNRSYTIEGLFTHPGDSRQATKSAPILAAPLMAPWGSMTGAVEFIRRLGPRQVIPIHDFYLSESGRKWVTETVRSVLEPDGIELVSLDWGQSLTL